MAGPGYEPIRLVHKIRESCLVLKCFCSRLLNIIFPFVIASFLEVYQEK